MQSDFWNLIPLYDANSYQRLVVSVTIMESLPIKDWAKGGELLLTSSKTLPHNTSDMELLIHDMCASSTAALAVKCRQQDKHHSNLQTLTQLAKDHQIPIFLIPEEKTYLTLTKGINLLLTQVDQRNTLKEYLLHYMLLSDNIREDAIIKHCMQSLQIPFRESSLQLFEFRLQNEQYVDESDLCRTKQTIFLKIYTFFEQLKTAKLLHDYLFMRAANTIHIAAIIQDETFSTHCLTQLQKLLPMYKHVFIGISSIHNEGQIKILFEEAAFACSAGYMLQKQPITTYAQVHLLRIIQTCKEIDQHAYFHQLIEPLIQYPFLMDTLLKYYRNNENQKATCEELFIHVNTLQYRLKKIEALTKLRLNNIGDKLNLYLSLISYTMENWRKTYDND